MSDPNTTKFSVLISVYAQETASNLEQCLYSIWDQQVCKPSQIVLVKDGPLTPSLEQVIKHWNEKLGEAIFNVITLDINKGLGKALATGMLHCKFDYVARMDSDDISLPNRFQLQMDLLTSNNIDICGSTIIEFDRTNKQSIKRVPISHEEIYKYSMHRNPLNHPSVIMKKKAILGIGNYQTFIGFEDYHLWVRALMKGLRFHNLEEPLLKMRVDQGLVARRRGRKYFIQEIKFHLFMHKVGHVSMPQLATNLLLRLPVRLVPESLSRTFYRIIRRL